jgi:hypothetical protein
MQKQSDSKMVPLNLTVCCLKIVMLKEHIYFLLFISEQFIIKLAVIKFDLAGKSSSEVEDDGIICLPWP